MPLGAPEFRPIPGYEAEGYLVSDIGTMAKRRKDGSLRPLRMSATRAGYVVVGLSKGGKSRAWTVHSLVLLAFVSPRPEGMVCRHLNDDPADNRLANLRYGTASQNAADAKLNRPTRAVRKSNMGGRPSRPYYWEARDGWYCTIRRRRIKLASGADAREEAIANFYKAMAAAGEVMQAPPGGWSVNALIDGFLGRAARENLAPVTQRLYYDLLNTVRGRFGVVKAKQFRADEYLEWVQSREGWSESTRGSYIGIVKRLFRWAASHGYVADDPMKHVKRPPLVQRRVVLTGEQIASVIAASADKEFAYYMTTLVETGARPGSIAIIEAKDIDWERSCVVLDRHKSRKKTGKPLRIHLTPRALEICREMADFWKVGPIFRNKNGMPWTRNAVRLRFARLREQLKLPKGGGAYSARHVFITDGLQRGLSVAAVAALAGHSGTAVVDSNYNRLSERDGFLKEQLAKVRPDATPLPPAPPSAPADPVASNLGMSREDFIRSLALAMKEIDQPTAPATEASTASQSPLEAYAAKLGIPADELARIAREVTGGV